MPIPFPFSPFATPRLRGVLNGNPPMAEVVTISGRLYSTEAAGFYYDGRSVQLTTEHSKTSRTIDVIPSEDIVSVTVYPNGKPKSQTEEGS
jgi:hypothetical protein